MGRKWTILLPAAAVAVFVLLVVVDPALAQQQGEVQTDPGQAGNNLGNTIRSLFLPLVFTIAGVMGLAAIVRRDFGLALTLLVLVVIILGFLIKDSPYETFGEGILRSVFGTDSGSQGT